MQIEGETDFFLKSGGCGIDDTYCARAQVRQISTSPICSPQLRLPVASKRGGNDKIVTAHRAVGNTYPYTMDTRLEDITLANNHSVDDFAPNI